MAAGETALDTIDSGKVNGTWRGVLRASRRAALSDAAQSATGLVLAVFLAFHLVFDAAILLGPEAADAVAHFFEGEPLLGSRHPWIVSVAAAGLLALVLAHAALALRRFPRSVGELRAFRAHARGFGHADTRLWWWQAVTGFLLFFLVSAHLLQVMLQPDAIGAEPSSLRVVAERAGWFYLLFLPVVLLHAAAGVYRLAMKWGWPAGVLTPEGRNLARRAAIAVGGAYLLLGLAALAAYGRMGLALAGG